MHAADSVVSNAVHYDEGSGHWINERVQRLAEVINDYNSALTLAWIPPDQRVDATPPYAVVHTMPTGYQYTVMLLEENELDHRVLARLFDMDHGGSVEARIENLENARTLLDYRERIARDEQRWEFANTLLKTPLNHYRLGKGKAIDL